MRTADTAAHLGGRNEAKAREGQDPCENRNPHHQDKSEVWLTPPSLGINGKRFKHL